MAPVAGASGYRINLLAVPPASAPQQVFRLLDSLRAGFCSRGFIVTQFLDNCNTFFPISGNWFSTTIITIIWT